MTRPSALGNNPIRPRERAEAFAASAVFPSTKTKGRVPDGRTSSTGADLGTSTPLRGTSVPQPAGPPGGLVTPGSSLFFGSLFPRWGMFSLDDNRDVFSVTGLF